VLVPETPVDEDYLLPGAENKVRVARYVTSVETIAVAHAMNQTTDDHFWFRVSVTDPGHPLASFSLGQWIVAPHRLVFSPTQTQSLNPGEASAP
jgi:hypothetical protein